MEQLFVTRGIFIRIRMCDFVDTGEEGDGAVNFAALDSDYSEPGKHV